MAFGDVVVNFWDRKTGLDIFKNLRIPRNLVYGSPPQELTVPANEINAGIGATVSALAYAPDADTGALQTTQIQAFFDALAVGYSASGLNVPSDVKSGYVGPGEFQMVPTVITSPGSGWTLNGEGMVSQLNNVSLVLTNVWNTVQDLFIMGAGGGAGGVAAVGVGLYGQRSLVSNVFVQSRPYGFRQAQELGLIPTRNTMLVCRTYTCGIGFEQGGAIAEVADAHLLGCTFENSRNDIGDTEDNPGVAVRFSNGGQLRLTASLLQSSGLHAQEILGFADGRNPNESYYGLTIASGSGIPGQPGNKPRRWKVVSIATNEIDDPDDSIIVTIDPVVTTFTGNTANGSREITGLNITADRDLIGLTLSGTGIPANAVVTEIVSDTTIRILKTATATGTAVAITASNPLDLQPGHGQTRLQGTGVAGYDDVGFGYIKDRLSDTEVVLFLNFVTTSISVNSVIETGNFDLYGLAESIQDIRNQFFIGSYYNRIYINGGYNWHFLGCRMGKTGKWVAGDVGSIFDLRNIDTEYGGIVTAAGKTAPSNDRTKDVRWAGPGSLRNVMEMGPFRLVNGGGYFPNVGALGVGMCMAHTDSGLGDDSLPRFYNGVYATNENVQVRSGAGTEWFFTGATFHTKDATAGSGQQLILRSGNGASGEASGLLTIQGGNAPGGNAFGAPVEIIGGIGRGTGSGGRVTIRGGTATGTGKNGELALRGRTLIQQSMPPADFSTSGVIAAASVANGFISTTPTTAGVELQLPLGADLDAEFSAVVQEDTRRLVVLNLSPLYAIRITTNTGWSLVGGATVQPNSSATFDVTRAIADGNWDLYRTANGFSDTRYNDLDGVTQIRAVNSSAGTAAVAEIAAWNGVVGTTAMRMIALGTGFTTAGHRIQDTGLIESGSTLSGMQIATLAGDLRIYTASTLALTVNASNQRTTAAHLINAQEGVTFTGMTLAAANAIAGLIAGRVEHITDSSTATWGATIAGGGANPVLAWYNGTNWTVVGS